MTTKEINEKIARICDWVWCEPIEQRSFENHAPSPYWKPPSYWWNSSDIQDELNTPNFCKDLNEMHKAMVFLDDKQMDYFISSLCAKTGGWNKNSLCADAETRARSFVYAIEHS